ncbi:MAG: pilus assembly protein MshO [Lysobacterales bacterium CG17_big_fil_post_rev_8_21_14_2_50_64_11]|nr:MAG: pilus assembly protein MshO [Xanthomonadales bacterium CG17_big_fil_post_rev_8_21_14_2_50_64_11]PIX59284.1 MAG: pilus assembly protein MshO [Xanthomonadales bacterium CG_4_10_14_3_um_filter_64_11]
MNLRSQQRRGFTLIEMIVVIVITGILAGVLSRFLSEPVRGYLQVASRGVLVDQADIALRRIASEVQRALPNSLRVACAGQCLEFLSSVDGGMYRAQVSGSNPADDPLDFTTADSSFDVLGGLRAAPAAGSQMVVYNLGTAPNNAYDGTNRATLAGASTINQIVLTAPIRFPQPSGKQRFYLVDMPVSYLCNPAAGSLRRNAGYPISAAQPSNTAQGDLLSDRVTACDFAFDPGSATRGGLLSMRLTLADGDERITLLHQVHVFNAP